MKKQICYCEAYLLEKLAEKVQKKLDEGWELYGTVVAVNSSEQIIYIQTVIKNNKEG